jgi:hypothetical protein
MWGLWTALQTCYTHTLDKLVEVNTTPGESKLFGVSIRGWIGIMLVGTCCYCQLNKIPIGKTVEMLTYTAVGFYMGQKNRDGGNSGPKQGGG